MKRYLLDIFVVGLILTGTSYLSAQQGPATLKGNGVAGVWSADQLCTNAANKDDYIGEVAANDIGLYTNGTNCTAGTLRFDITATVATFASTIQQVVQTGSTDSTASSFYAHDIDSTLAAGVGNNTASLNGVIRGILRGANLTSTAVAQSALHGVFFVTGTDSSTWPKAAVIGEVHDNSTVADAAVVALMGGDAGNSTQATAAFATRSLSSTPTNQFTYGLDLGGSISGFTSAANLIKTADVRFSKGGLLFVSMTTAVTANVTTTTAPAGSIGITSSATGNATIWISDGTKWQKPV